MKKIVFMIVAMLSITTVKAENENANNVNDIEAYDMSVNMRRLASTLELENDQIEAVENIHNTFSAEMMFAAHKDGEERTAMAKKAIDKDVKFMRYVLNDKQYRKYLLLLNITLNNRGLNK